MKHLLVIISAVILTSFYYPFKKRADNEFMIMAAQSNFAEIGAAKVALSQSASDSVKSYAQMMIDDHTAAQTELGSLAQSKGVTLPDSADAEHRMLKQQLLMMQGESFDSAYIQSQVKDHVKAVALFQTEVSNGTDADTKALAAKLLPKLQMHLQHAQHLAGMNGMNNMQQ